MQNHIEPVNSTLLPYFSGPSQPLITVSSPLLNDHTAPELMENGNGVSNGLVITAAQLSSTKLDLDFATQTVPSKDIWKGEEMRQQANESAGNPALRLLNLDAEPTFPMDVSTPASIFTDIPTEIEKDFHAEIETLNFSESKDRRIGNSVHPQNVLPMSTKTGIYMLSEDQQINDVRDTSSQLIQSALLLMKREHTDGQSRKRSAVQKHSTWKQRCKSLIQEDMNKIGTSKTSVNAFESNAGRRANVEFQVFDAASEPSVRYQGGFRTARESGMYGGVRQEEKLFWTGDEAYSAYKDIATIRQGQCTKPTIDSKLDRKANKNWAFMKLPKKDLKMRRVKDCESVEKCRLKQQLRIEALQLEKGCLLDECKLIKSALEKVESYFPMTSKQGHLGGISPCGV